MNEITDGAYYKLFPDDPKGVPWTVTISRDGTQISLTNQLQAERIENAAIDKARGADGGAK